MNNMNRLRIRYFITCMMTALLGYGSQAIANGPAPSGPPDLTVGFTAGQACSFALNVEIWDNGKRSTRTFEDKNGVIREIAAGTGSALRFSNADIINGKTFSTKSNGAVSKITYNLDGSYTQTLTGHNVVILFPTDIPVGPSTTLYDGGKVVLTVDSLFVTTVINETGKIIDICDAVS